MGVIAKIAAEMAQTTVYNLIEEIQNDLFDPEERFEEFLLCKEICTAYILAFSFMTTYMNMKYLHHKKVTWEHFNDRARQALDTAFYTIDKQLVKYEVEFKNKICEVE